MVVQEKRRPTGRKTVRRAIGILLAAATMSGAGLAQAVYQESGGLLVVELESGAVGGQWSEETEHDGYTGESYLLWAGPNYFGEPGHDSIAFDFVIHEPGLYHFRIRNRHEHPDSTEENDCFVRMDGGEWVKTFSPTAHQWTWGTYHEFDDANKPPAQYELSAGQHTIEFSGRSYGFMLDRFHLYRPDHPDGQNPDAPESSTETVNRRPIPAIQITPPSIPADDGGNTVITLSATSSEDPDVGQQLTYLWTIPSAEFVNGTNRRSPVAQIRVPGGKSWPVRLEVKDNARPPAAATLYSVINVDHTEGAFSGEPAAWHTLELAFEGPGASETDSDPNPFLDYRLRVDFTGPDGQEYRVHGFFDGDGNGGGTGNVWKVRLTPSAGGTWHYRATFKAGSNVAIVRNGGAGEAVAFHGAEGDVLVMGRDRKADGFLSQGALEYVGEHYLKFRDGGFFIKGGTDSPENFLGYRGFDDIHDNGGLGLIHEYPSHRTDFQPGDPVFESNTTGYDSRGIIGALNYLSSRHVNSIYFLPMNLGGDGQETCPFVGYGQNSFDKRHYDISRMAQWHQVFEHAQRKGVMLHFVLAETEQDNENWLDDGELGVERKLFFRELVARFGHNLALKWNLSEENDYSVTELRDFADYLEYLDPYDHPITVHTHPNNFEDYVALVGDELFSASSIQYDPNLAENHVETWRTNSAATGRKWVIDMDENNPASEGLTDTNATDLRKRVLYDVLFSGGNVEWYAGYHSLPLGGDLKMENFRTREAMWDYMWHARTVMERTLPFWEMVPADHLLTGESSSYGGGEVLAQEGQVYAVYLPSAESTGKISLTGFSGTFRGRWYNPRIGRFQGPARVMQGDAARNLNEPPSSPQEDWVFILKKQP